MKKQTMEEYVSLVVHELRSPLADIQQAISLIMDGCLKDDPAKCLKILQIAMDGTTRLNERIGEYLDPEKFRELTNC